MTDEEVVGTGIVDVVSRTLGNSVVVEDGATITAGT